MLKAADDYIRDMDADQQLEYRNLQTRFTRAIQSIPGLSMDKGLALNNQVERAVLLRVLLRAGLITTLDWQRELTELMEATVAGLMERAAREFIKNGGKPPNGNGGIILG